MGRPWGTHISLRHNIYNLSLFLLVFTLFNVKNPKFGRELENRGVCASTADQTLGVPQPRHFHHKSCCPPARPLNPNRMSATFFKRRFVVRGPQRDDPFLPSSVPLPSPLFMQAGGVTRGGALAKVDQGAT